MTPDSASCKSRPRSEVEFARAQRVIPGGVNSPARAFGAVGGTPPFIARGSGPYLFDIDGHQYIDYVSSWGPHLFGHCFPAIVDAITEALATGTSFGAPTMAESELAELVTSLFPSMQKIRMVNSGTEATMSSIRLARGFTGRDVIVKFAGCYHGHVDSLLVQAGSGALTLGCPSSPGVPKGCTADTMVLAFNDVSMLQQAFAQHGSTLAAVILEPVCGNMGCVVPTSEFLAALRQLCSDHGVVLIFDEVMCGFRVAAGGAQQLFDVTPDLTCLGKILGAGMPVGAYGGRDDIMSCISPLGQVYQAGTLSGNPVAMAAGIAMLKTIRAQNPYPRLEQLGQQLEAGLRDAAASNGVPLQINRVGSMLTAFFADQPVQNFESATRSDTARFSKWFHAMLDRGVYLPCSQYEALFISAVHTEELIERTVQAAREALAE